MANKIDTKLLANSWVHSHEEDSDSEMVFRPSTFKFPPSRGRTSFQLNADGTLAHAGIGPDDRSVKTSGHWAIGADNTLTFYDSDGKTATSKMQVSSVQGDKLMVKK